MKVAENHRRRQTQVDLGVGRMFAVTRISCKLDVKQMELKNCNSALGGCVEKRLVVESSISVLVVVITYLGAPMVIRVDMLVFV